MWFLYALTILAGLANAIQPGQNATLSKSLGLPVTAALLTLLVSTIGLLAGGLALGKLEIPTGQQLGQVPWWAWLGGFLSILLILAQLYASPRHRRGDIFGDHRHRGRARFARARPFRVGRVPGAPGEFLARRRGGVDGDRGGVGGGVLS